MAHGVPGTYFTVVKSVIAYNTYMSRTYTVHCASTCFCFRCIYAFAFLSLLMLVDEKLKIYENLYFTINGSTIME